MRRAPPTKRESGRCGGPLFRFRVEPLRARHGARPATGPARAGGRARDLLLGDPLSLLGGLPQHRSVLPLSLGAPAALGDRPPRGSALRAAAASSAADRVDGG